MGETFEHLVLPLLSEDFSRKKRGGGGYKKTDRDENQFYKAELQALEITKKKFLKQKERLKDYLDPNLIFKINVNQDVYENSFRDELRRAGIEVISPSPDKMGYWVVFAEDEDLSIFKEKLKEHFKNNRYKFFYAIGEILDIPPEEKIGERLLEEPLLDDDFSYLDVEIWRMEDNKLIKFLSGFDTLINEKSGRIIDVLKTKNFCLLKIKANNQNRLFT